MPIDIAIQGKSMRIYPTATSKELQLDNAVTLQDIEVATKHFYVKVSKKKINQPKAIQGFCFYLFF